MIHRVASEAEVDAVDEATVWLVRKVGDSNEVCWVV